MASAIRGETSPSKPLGVSTPMGPSRISARRALNATAFSPVAPSSAPARSIAAVARELVPSARTWRLGHFFFTASTRPRPMPPPWPSTTATSSSPTHHSLHSSIFRSPFQHTHSAPACQLLPQRPSRLAERLRPPLYFSRMAATMGGAPPCQKIFRDVEEIRPAVPYDRCRTTKGGGGTA